MVRGFLQNGCRAGVSDFGPTSISVFPGARSAAALRDRDWHILTAAEREGLRDGAVLALLLPRDDDYAVVFTRRTEDVATHKGQIALAVAANRAIRRSVGDRASGRRTRRLRQSGDDPARRRSRRYGDQQPVRADSRRLGLALE